MSSTTWFYIIWNTRRISVSHGCGTEEECRERVVEAAKERAEGHPVDALAGPVRCRINWMTNTVVDTSPRPTTRPEGFVPPCPIGNMKALMEESGDH